MRKSKGLDGEHSESEQSSEREFPSPPESGVQGKQESLASENMASSPKTAIFQNEEVEPPRRMNPVKKIAPREIYDNIFAAVSQLMESDQDLVRNRDQLLAHLQNIQSDYAFDPSINQFCERVCDLLEDDRLIFGSDNINEFFNLISYYTYKLNYDYQKQYAFDSDSLEVLSYQDYLVLRLVDNLIVLMKIALNDLTNDHLDEPSKLPLVQTVSHRLENIQTLYNILNESNTLEESVLAGANTFFGELNSIDVFPDKEDIEKLQKDIVLFHRKNIHPSSEIFLKILGHLEKEFYKELDESNQDYLRRLVATFEKEVIARNAVVIPGNILNIKSQLGSGSYGTVYKALSEHGEVVAIKVAIGDAQWELVNEAKMLSTISHPNIIRPFAMCIATGGLTTLVMEFAEQGSLSDFLKVNPTLPMIERLAIVHDLTKGVEYLHSQEILHRDLKPANVLVSHEGLKIADFGMAIKAMIEPYHSRPGTRLYRAPELLDLTSKDFDPPKGAYCTKATDIFAVGLIAWRTTTGQKLSEEKGWEQKRVEGTETPYPQHFPPEIKAAGEGALDTNPQSRFTAKDLRERYQSMLNKGEALEPEPDPLKKETFPTPPEASSEDSVAPSSPPEASAEDSFASVTPTSHKK